MRILVTGAGGFLGQYVVSALRKRGDEVIPTDINISVRRIRCLDVTAFSHDKFAEIKPELVIHLAALTGATGKGGGVESMKDPFNFFRVNIMGTLNVFETCRKSDISKVIHMSSFSPYGVTEEAITEETPLNSNNPYGFSKECGELVAKCYAMNYGIKTIIFRAPLVCGEGQRELNALREFVTRAKENKPIVIFGSGEHVREWVHPLDVADAFVRAATYFDKMVNPYEIFILGSKPISMKALAHLVIKIVGKGHVKHQPSAIKLFNQYTDPSKVRRLLGWKPSIPVEEIIMRIANEDAQRMNMAKNKNKL